MLKTLETAEDAGLSTDAYLVEPSVNLSLFFTGVRTAVVNGVAHLLFYAEQPSGDSSVEHVIVARLVAPEMRAAAILNHAASQIAKGPEAIGRPAN